MKKTALYILGLALCAAIANSAMAQKTWIDKDIKKLVAGIQISYINQGARINYDDYMIYSDRVWELNADKKVSGFSVGFPLQHSFGTSGFAILWGINSEFYFSSNNPDANVINEEALLFQEKYTNYFELTLTIPLHLQFTLPVLDSRKWVLGFHTGPSYSFTVMGKYTDNRGYNSDYDYFDHGSVIDFISNNRNSVYFDLGLLLQYTFIRLDFVWSRGITTIESNNVYDTYRNRFLAGVTFFFGY